MMIHCLRRPREAAGTLLGPIEPMTQVSSLPFPHGRFLFIAFLCSVHGETKFDVYLICSYFFVSTFADLGEQEMVVHFVLFRCGFL